MLSRLELMVQATGLDGHFFDLFSPFDDSGVPAKVGIDRGDVVQALVVAKVVVVIDELSDLFFQVTRHVIVLQQDSVFQRLMRTLDLALGLRLVSKPDELDTPLAKTFKRPKSSYDGQSR